MSSYLAVFQQGACFRDSRLLALASGALAVLTLLWAASAYSQDNVAAIAVDSSDSGASNGTGGTQQIEEKLRELDMVLLEKNVLQERLRDEKNTYEAAALQSSSLQKMIRLELEDFFAQDASQERLVSLLADFKRSAEEQDKARLQVAEAEKQLSEQQVKFTLAERNVEQLKARLAAEVRERDSKRVKTLARRLDKNLFFDETVSFRCSPSKTLDGCLKEYDRFAEMPEWVLKNYQGVLSKELSDQVESVSLSPDWFTYRSSSKFTDASMDLGGRVTAHLSVEASVAAKKIMPCALLGVAEELCDINSYALVIRSNRFNDRVWIDDQPQGATPLSLQLGKGLYKVKVVVDGVTKERSVSLHRDRTISFAF